MKKKVLILNGPNLNMLGRRQPEIYGTASLAEINSEIETHAEKHGIECTFFQTNHEGEIIDIIQNADGVFCACVLNAGAYSHYSYAIRDAIASVSIHVFEVHLSDIYSREEFRRTSVISEVCLKTIAGHGVGSYKQAIDEIAEWS